MSKLTMSQLRAALPAYFAEAKQGEALSRAIRTAAKKSEARAAIAAMFTGCSLQWAHSGNNAHIVAIAAAINTTEGQLKSALKTLQGLDIGKPAHLADASLESLKEYAENTHAAAMSLLALPEKPKAEKSATDPFVSALTKVSKGCSDAKYNVEQLAALQQVVAAALAVANAPAAPL